LREYLSGANLKQAALLGGVVGVMALPSIVEAGRATPAFCGATLSGMVLVAGFATAWQRHGGMAGLFPGRQALRWGVPLAVLFAVLLWPIYYVIEPPLEAALRATPLHGRVELFFPSTLATRVAYLLWTCGFELLFFHAAAQAFFARLTHSREAAIGAAVVFRALVGYLQLGSVLPGDLFQFVLALQMLRAVMTALVFAHFGLPPAVLLTLLVDGRHFF